MNTNPFTLFIGLLFAFGFTGLSWVCCSHLSKLRPEKTAGFSIAFGMTVSFSYLLSENGKYRDPLTVLITVGIILYSYFAARSAIRDHLKKEAEQAVTQKPGHDQNHKNSQ